MLPPIGFLKNHANFQSFIEAKLRRDEEGRSPACDEDWFSPIDDKYKPNENLFEVGHKLEAMDYRNFNGKLAPATVVEVDEEYITLNFVGWTHGYNIKERFDSRHLFPVGYAERNDLDLQPPKKMKKSVKRIKTASSSTAAGQQQKRPESNASAASAPATVSADDYPSPKLPSALTAASRAKGKSDLTDARDTPTPPVGKRKAANGEKKGGKAKRSASPTTVHVKLEQAVDRLTASAKAKERSADSVSGPAGKRSKRSSSNSHSGTPDQQQAFRPKAHKSLGSKQPSHQKQHSRRQTDRTSYSSESVNGVHGGSHPPSPADCLTPDITVQLSSKKSFSADQLMMTVFVNSNCACGTNLDGDKLQLMPPQIGPANVHHVVRETVQQLVNAAENPDFVWEKIERGTGQRLLTVTSDHGPTGETRILALPVHTSVDQAWKYVNKLLKTLDGCPNLLSKEENLTCDQCQPEDDDGASSYSFTRRPSNNAFSKSGNKSAKQPQQQTNRSNESDSDQSSTNLETAQHGGSKRHTTHYDVDRWSVADVADAVTREISPQVGEKFRNQLIDGKALRLLPTLGPEQMMKLLDMLCGPTMKVIDWVNSLTAGQK